MSEMSSVGLRAAAPLSEANVRTAAATADAVAAQTAQAAPTQADTVAASKSGQAATAISLAAPPPPEHVYAYLMTPPADFNAAAVSERIQQRFTASPTRVSAEIAEIGRMIEQFAADGDFQAVSHLQTNLKALDPGSKTAFAGLHDALAKCLYTADLAMRKAPQAEVLPTGTSTQYPGNQLLGRLIIKETTFAAKADGITRDLIARYHQDPAKVLQEMREVESELSVNGQTGGDRSYIETVLANLTQLNVRGYDKDDHLADLQQALGQAIVAGEKAIAKDP